jgi:hypothetical protein
MCKISEAAYREVRRRTLVGKLQERTRLDCLGIDGRKIFKKAFQQQIRLLWSAYIWLSTGTSRRVCEICNEASGSIKRGEFLDELRYYI